MYYIIEELLYPNIILSKFVFIFCVSVFTYIPLTFIAEPNFFMNLYYWLMYSFIVNRCDTVSEFLLEKFYNRLYLFFIGLIMPITFALIHKFYGVSV